MKKIIIVIVAALLASKIVQAQGTIYDSNLGQPSTGNEAAGSDSWLGAPFETGTNAGGYSLGSIQLAMTDATGNPNSFVVMIYSKSSFAGAVLPGSSLDTLDGSANPSTAGIYTYTPASSLTLSPGTWYFIVLTAGTSVTDGAYQWSLAGTYSYNTSDGWYGTLSPAYSGNGSSWTLFSAYPQFAITAEAIPEPSSAFLLLLGSGVFLYVRRAFQQLNSTRQP